MGLGRPCVVPEGLEFALVRSAALIKLSESAHPEFIEQAIQHSWAQRQIQAYLSRSAQPNIFQGQIASIELPIPPLDEQRQIADILKDFDKDINMQTEYSDQLKRLKRGLMQDLLSGTVRTADTNIEVPEEIAQHG
jgi:type I restriction enzyme S subunit